MTKARFGPFWSVRKYRRTWRSGAAALSRALGGSSGATDAAGWEIRIGDGRGVVARGEFARRASADVDEKSRTFA